MIHERQRMRAGSRRILRAAILLISLAVSALSAVAQTTSAPSPEPSPTQSPATKKDVEPIENSDDKKSKLTFGIYFFRGSALYDLNLRHQFGPLTAWIAGFYDRTGSNRLMRVGAQYDYRKAWFHFVPSLEVATS